MFKRAYTLQMNVNIPDAEKKIAEQASEAFESVIAKLKLGIEHLDLLYTPFAKRESLDSEEVVENRDILRKYRDNTKNIFEDIIKHGLMAVSLMGDFSTDSDVEELMGSFVSSIKDLEKQVNYLLSIFSNLNSTEFRDSLLASIDSVKKKSSQLKQLINDRILEHIDTNILAKNWESLVNDRYQNKVKDKTPLMVQLYNERQKALK